MSDSIEKWRPVVGWWGYYSISTLGRVRSEARTITDKNGKARRVRERFLRLGTTKAGYHLFVARKPGLIKSMNVHSEVLKAFIGPAPLCLECRHKNGKPFDNRLRNLVWGTTTENQRDRAIHGTSNRCERGATKLTAEQVLEIRKATGAHAEIAREFGISKAYVPLLKRRERWTYLEEE